MESPLLKEENYKEEEKEEYDLKGIIDEKKFEEHLRDKLISEFFKQNFIIYKANILIVVVGIITINE